MKTESTIDEQRLLVDALRTQWSRSAEVEVIETHISWVLLTGERAYKLKKAVNFGFLDYSTLERRRHCCDEELRLNRRTAPELYLAVTPVGGTRDAPRLNEGTPIEWCVEMRRFDQSQLLDRRLAKGLVKNAEMDSVAVMLAHFHGTIPAADASSTYGDPAEVYGPIADNFPAIQKALRPHIEQLDLGHHALWAARQFEFLRPLIAARKAGGKVRECHGDLHLGNMVQMGDRILGFDGIEFNAHLRWIDVANELAFVAMDLEARGAPELSRHLVNAYLERTGDYDAVALLDFYKHYRAMVRAKVTALRYAQTAEGDAARMKLLEEFGGYLTLAGSYTQPTPRAIVLTSGVTGSGKTRIVGALVDHLPRAIRVRSDVERKRLFGLAPESRSHSTVESGIYSAEATRRTYDQLLHHATTILRGGYTAIVDATFLRSEDRLRFHQLAKSLDLPLVLICATAPEKVLRERVTARLAKGRDASEADVQVLERQLANQEPLRPEEEALAIWIDTTKGYEAEALTEQVVKQLGF